MKLNIHELKLLRFALEHAVKVEQDFIECHMVHGRYMDRPVVAKTRVLIRRLLRLRKRVEAEILARKT